MKSIVRLSTIVLVAVVFQAQAIAQSGIEEIVVTAKRRESLAQDTAIAMSIYSADSIAENGIYDIGSLVKFDPHVHFTGSGEGFITIRGITSTDTTESGDPAVPVAFDEFYTNRPLAHYGTVYDIERVEVLRGPQGTLFGRNSVGGIINIYTAKPVHDFAASGSIEVGNYNTKPNPYLRGRQIRDGRLRFETANYIENAWENKDDMAKVSAEVAKMEPGDGPQWYVNQVYRIATQDPRKLLPIMEKCQHIHGKTWGLTEDCVDPAVDLSDVIPTLIEGGYDGVIATEYEGQRMVQDIHPFSAVEMVRRHHVMLRRLLGEV